MPTMAKHTTIWHPLKTTPLSLLYYALLLHTLLSLLYYALFHIYTTLPTILCITPHIHYSPLYIMHYSTHYSPFPFASPPPQLPLCSKLYHLHLHHHGPNSNNLPQLDSVVAFAFASDCWDCTLLMLP